MAGLERIHTASSMAEIFARMTGRTTGELFSANSRISVDDFKRSAAENFNSQDGNLQGYDCALCKNRGHFMRYDEHNQTTVLRDCVCMEMRRRIAMLEASGLKDKLEECTFDNFIAQDDWQKEIKTMAQEFAVDCNGHWFFIGGQVGSGKTHICTAIVGELLRQSMPTRYMLWRDDVVRIKQVVNNDEEYALRINDLKDVKVLYIDDFLKVQKGGSPTPADINVAFEVLNYRYNQKDLVTIISSEYTIYDILNMDESVGSRIYERAKKYTAKIGQDKKKNQRTNKAAASTPRDKEAEYWWQK